MRNKLPILLCLLLTLPMLLAQPKESGKGVAPPTTEKQAKDMFVKAWELEREQKFNDALEHYNAVVVYFRKLKDPVNLRYTMAVYNNMGGILVNIGKYDRAGEIFKGALEIALKLDDYAGAAQYHHKLGIIYKQLALIKQKKAEMKNMIFPKEKKVEGAQRVLFSKGTYIRLSQVGKEFVANRIQMRGTMNPFQKLHDLYTKIVNVKIKGDFDPKQLLVPDSVEFLIQIRKKGYFTLSEPRSLLPEMDYTEVNGKLVSIPRMVEPVITEDFYRQGAINPDEITLTPVENEKTSGKPIQVTNKEKFKPGHYRLSIQKRGYKGVTEHLVIYPGEGNFSFSRQLNSKMRKVVYRVQGDFTALGNDQVEPDEISLNGQPIRKDSTVKPGEYKLVIKKEGYEPVIKNLIIEPDERPVFINEFMKSLPREVVFQISGDFQKDEILTPDEVTLNGRFIKYGESVKPDAYRVVVRKKGYDVISERIIIKPKNEPFILKKQLVSTPRRIQLNLVAAFPAGLRIFPDNCTLNGKDVAIEESFKPAEYTLYIKRSGYKTITKKVKISPDDVPFVIRDTLKPKQVQINLEITQDVPHEDSNIKPKITILNEKTQEVVALKSGDKIMPESYVLKIEMPGYEPEVAKELIMPSEEPYNISKRLIASPRTVVTKITAEYPEDETIVPDEITLDNKAISKDFKIKPGAHDLVLLKEGYLPVRKPLKILASASEYLLLENLETRSRLVNFKFRDSYDRRELNPDEVNIGKQRLAAIKDTLNLKPGEYNLRARLKGYAGINENVLIPVGAEPFTIEKFMVAIKRDVITDITGDYKPDEKLVPDVFTINDMPIAEKATVKPGIYNLVLQKEGYFPILQRITIRPDPKPYLLKYKMISKPRQLNIIVKSSFNNSKINPDTMVLGTQNVKEGQDIKPASYAMLIKKKGYKQLNDQVVIEPAEKPYVLERTLEAKPVLVKYLINNDFNEQAIVPEIITLNDKIVDQKTSFMPGKYSLRVEKIGYNPLKKEIVIEPSNEPLLVKETLVSLPREIELVITGDFPAGERIDAEVIALNGKDARDNIFKPGKYQLDIQQPGYVSLKETVLIPPGEEPFLVERILVTKPRRLQEKITYDVAPPEDLPPYKLTLAPVEKPKAEKIVKEGDLVKPGSYILRITKEAYETVEIKKHVWPAEAPLVLERELVAKQVVLRVNIVYNIEPPKNLEEYKVSLIDKATLIPRFISDGKRVKPGSYFLDVQRPGYTFGPRQEIDIQPSEQPFHINKKLLAKPRRISFDMVDEKTNALVPAYQIMINNKPVSFKDTFKPGSEFDLVVKFKKYQTVKKRTRVVPGEGPFVEHVPLKPLTRYEFSVRKDKMTLDGITYSFMFFADNQKIEKHLIHVEKGVGRFYYTIWVTPTAKSLKVYAGYMFTQKAFSRLRLGIGSLRNISVAKLIEHLESKSKGERGRRAALEVLEKMLKSYKSKRMMKQAAPSEIDQLMQYVEGWKMNDARDRVRMKVVIDAISALK